MVRSNKSISKIFGTPAADRSVYFEAEVDSGETITPGMICVPTGLNSENDPIVAPADTIDEVDPTVWIATVPDVPPRTTDSDTPINHEYDAGENIELRVPRAGDTIQNLLLAAGSDLASAGDADVEPGEKIGTNDDGTAKVTSTSAAAFAVAEEDNDNSGASGGDWARLYVRCL